MPRTVAEARVLVRPVRAVGYEDDHWAAWLATDQRNAGARPDVLSFTGPVLTRPVTVAGTPRVHLTASTSGSDSDWVVKLIDVYPDAVPSDPPMGGYELGVAMEIFRGRYRESFEKPSPIPAGKVQKYRYELPLGEIARIWRAGCIIRAELLGDIMAAYQRDPQLVNLLLDSQFRDAVESRQENWRLVVQAAEIGRAHV